MVVHHSKLYNIIGNPHALYSFSFTVVDSRKLQNCLLAVWVRVLCRKMSRLQYFWLAPTWDKVLDHFYHLTMDCDGRQFNVVAANSLDHCFPPIDLETHLLSLLIWVWVGPAFQQAGTYHQHSPEQVKEFWPNKMSLMPIWVDLSRSQSALVPNELGAVTQPWQIPDFISNDDQWRPSPTCMDTANKLVI